MHWKILVSEKISLRKKQTKQTIFLESSETADVGYTAPPSPALQEIFGMYFFVAVVVVISLEVALGCLFLWL